MKLRTFAVAILAVAAMPAFAASVLAANPELEGTELAVASGLTTIHGASRTSYEEVQRRIKLYEVGLLRIRINEMVDEDAARRLGEPLNLDDEYFVQSVKAFADGGISALGLNVLNMAVIPGLVAALVVEPVAPGSTSFGVAGTATGPAGAPVTVTATPAAVTVK